MAKEKNPKTSAPEAPTGTAASRAQARRRAAKVHEEETFLGAIWDWTKSIGIGFLIFIVIRTFLIQTFTIISGSMENTLLIGDFLVLSKSAYGATIPGTEKKLPGYSQPKRNDIVVFRSHHQEPQIDLVKRLVGMPGDTLSMKGGQLHRNGVALVEPYVQHIADGNDGYDPTMEWQKGFLTDSVRAQPYYPTRDNWGPIVVPDTGYFMMGDNRDSSLDSRYWAFVPKRDLMGRAVGLYFSYDKFDADGIPFFGHIRWGRIGNRLH
ncbi:MAG: signal peptidase I [Longimicrobiales bacterium]